MATFQPWFLSSLTVSTNPGISGKCCLTSCKMPSGASFKVATRWRRLWLKSSSPRIARSVMAETILPVPASLAISSMHSIWMAVESMSITNNPACFKLAWKFNGAISSANSWAMPIHSAFHSPLSNTTVLCNTFHAAKHKKFSPHFCWKACSVVKFSLSE